MGERGKWRKIRLDKEKKEEIQENLGNKREIEGNLGERGKWRKIGLDKEKKEEIQENLGNKREIEGNCRETERNLERRGELRD